LIKVYSKMRLGGVVMKKWIGLIALAAVMAGVGALGLLGAAVNKPVRVDTGLLQGVTDANGVTAYKGIPFGAPPVGDLRWRPPQPAAHWDGVRDASQFGAACMQNERGSSLPWTEEFMTAGPISEDCLFLNVWTGAKSANEKRPVMVWMYGGGFNEGAGSITVYDGAALAKKGVVLVSMNYRMGALGFLVYPELTKESEHYSSGNYGLLDQIAALQWVHKNIAAFGGDPDKVTIFGQSAGALSVGLLMQSPLAKGLFARAIAESGPGLIARNALGGGTTLADREQAGVKYAEFKGAHSLAELRAIPAANFYAPGGGRGAPGPGATVVDGWVVPLAPPDNQVPLLAGMVADDNGISGGGGGAGQKPSVSSYEAAAQKKYGAQADAFLKLYPVASDDTVAATQKDANRDLTRVGMDLWAADQIKMSKKVYTYYFDRVIPWPAHPEFGAFHTSDVPYVFENIHKMDRPWEPVDDQVSDAVSSYWVNFAATGNPNGKGLAEWPAYSDGSHTTMELGAKMGPMPVADSAKLDFFLAFLKQPAGN
jgi:para-nitrobenzyl esterase